MEQGLPGTPKSIGLVAVPSLRVVSGVTGCFCEDGRFAVGKLILVSRLPSSALR